MKKIQKMLAVGLSIVFLMAILLGCGESKKGEETTQTAEKNQSAATEAVKTETPTEAPKKDWKVDYYVDEFDQPTEDRLVYALFSGKFSNSATTDSRLDVKMVVDNEYVGIFLYEYGNNQVKNNGSYNDGYSITLRDAEGNKTDLKGKIYGGGDRILVEGSNREKFIEHLMGEEDFQVYIVDDEYQTSTYLFTVSPSNFKDVFEQ